MRPSVSTSLPLLFPMLLMVSTFPMIINSGGEDGIAAGALFASASMPAMILSYHFAKKFGDDLMFVRGVFPILGFYPFAYAIRSPFSLALAFLMLSIIALSAREFKIQNSKTSSLIFVFSLLTCLGLPTNALLMVGLALLLPTYYFLRERVELQYLLSYMILWGLINWHEGADSTLIGMEIIFGAGIFLLMHSVGKIMTTHSGGNVEPFRPC
ncbi:hypothetical protein [Pyrococcus sp. ST04]|uniref:hypothetical protein n=1 Tax=Pyrococcus sp. ST04 TaxID=1183377 RepID=UPI0002605D8B|nr:hypothetical protein [Pyrococcus sp. ST04]AFK22474.1 hypothetical protein Py04_0887 [Pyrococcus sp. ST04]